MRETWSPRRQPNWTWSDRKFSASSSSSRICSGTYLPDHPMVMQVSARLNQLTITYIRAQRQRWLRRQGSGGCPAGVIRSAAQVGIDTGGAAGDFDRLKTELARIERDLDIVENRINEVSVNQDAGSLNISIAQPAVASPKPSHPVKLKVLAGSLLVGLLRVSAWRSGEKSWQRVRGRRIGFPRSWARRSWEYCPTWKAWARTSAARAIQTHLEPTGAVAEALARNRADAGGIGFGRRRRAEPFWSPA